MYGVQRASPHPRAIGEGLEILPAVLRLPHPQAHANATRRPAPVPHHESAFRPRDATTEDPCAEDENNTAMIVALLAARNSSTLTPPYGHHGQLPHVGGPSAPSIGDSGTRREQDRVAAEASERDEEEK